uniref:G domain-containing protein n=1 Tax=Panagrellus redivivus TaxID=6233 RepID=A0A7E4V2T3_PANRE
MLTDDSLSVDFSEFSLSTENSEFYEDNVPTYTVAVIGSCGAGKSTLINNINCMFTHSDISEAAKNPLPLLMPVSFYHQIPKQRNLVQVEIKQPENLNERFNGSSHSVTFEPMDYVVDFKDFRIRFIDTPGTDDPRGNDQDKLNVNAIVEHLNLLPEVHGFLFVIKNNAENNSICNTLRLLLGVLPPCALKNCFFVYTFTDMTPFKPGSAPYILEKFITKFRRDHNTADLQLTADNQFYVNNFSFLDLCARQAGFGGRSTTLYRNTWDTSRLYVSKFLEKVQTVEPVMRIDFVKTREFIKIGELLRLIKPPKSAESDRLMATVANATLNGTAISFRNRTKYVRQLCSDTDWAEAEDYWDVHDSQISDAIRSLRPVLHGEPDFEPKHPNQTNRVGSASVRHR